MKHNIKRFTILLAISLFVPSCSHKTESSAPAVKAQFTIATEDLAVPAEIGTNSAPAGGQATIVVHVRFSKTKAEEFRKFTREHINQQTQILVGPRVVAEALIGGEISDGQADLVFSSFDKAREVADSLNKK
jgi:preprotein translocase subunit SecD